MSVNKKQKLFKTNDELMLASEHLGYEFGMFIETFILLNKNLNKEPILTNILIESITMRIRILLHFFYAEDAHKDDILAEHFFDVSKDWISLRGEMPVELENVKSRVAKEIVHLTYKRLNKELEEKKWDIQKLGIATYKLIKLFLEHVPKDKLDKNYFNNGKLI